MLGATMIAYVLPAQTDSACNIVERILDDIKQYRRLVTCCDKRAAKNPACLRLASVRLWL